MEKEARGFTLTIGLFFDGTGNNAINTQNMLNVVAAGHYDLNDPQAQSILAKYARENFGVSGIRANSYLGYYTNVYWLYTLYKQNTSSSTEEFQYPIYIDGIGTQTGKPDSTIGGGLGISDSGVIAKTNKAVSILAEHIQKALDTIRQEQPGPVPNITSLQFDIFGFSRGAAAARHFANRIQSGDPLIIHAVRQSMHGIAYSGLPAGKTRFIGIFDTVAAIGTPMNGLNPHSANSGEVILTLRPGVADKVFHITAAHECRFNFALNSVKPAWPELALPGVHSDIGGGYLPVITENLFLTRPETQTVPLTHPDEETRVYKQALAQLSKLNTFPTLAPLLRNHKVSTETWFDDRMPLDRYGQMQKRSYAALTLRERIVRNDWAGTALRVMLEAAQSAGVLFDEKREDENFDLSPDLIPLCEKALAMGKAVRAWQAPPVFTEEELDMLAGKYIHCSANWNVIAANDSGIIQGGASPSELISFVNRPDAQWKRTVYNMDGQKV